MLALFLFLIYFVFLSLILSDGKLSGSAWWVKIMTQQPKCTYYFGPFDSQEEATANQSGYLQDLETEGAQEVQVYIQQGKPRNLTIFQDSW